MQNDKLIFLVVDDSNISRKWFIEAIPESIRKNIDIKEASNGEEALEIFKQNPSCIVFLDITMPVKNGFETLEEIKQIDKEAVVVMVSADRQKSTKQKVLDMGAKKVLNKPIDSDELRDVLLEIISG